MTPTFVDTGAWIALLKRDDHMHAQARDYYEQQLASGTRFLTTNYVVDETATRLRYDAGLPAALAFRRALDRSVAERRVRLSWIDPGLEREGWDILERYADVSLSLTDATSVAAARKANIRDVFGFDADFRALGFNLQPAV